MNDERTTEEVIESIRGHITRLNELKKFHPELQNVKELWWAMEILTGPEIEKTLHEIENAE